MKNIVICCDGTGDPCGENSTNVVYTVRDIAHTEQQIVFYDTGIGTVNFLGKPCQNSVGALLGKAFGYGLKLKVIDLYQFLMRHFHAGDQVFLFGFSRGAYTARTLAGMLHKCGLLEDAANSLIPQVSKIYFQKDNARQAAQFKDTHSRICTPHFIGVWETVSALGYFYGKTFPNNRLNPNIKFAYQAVAVDEEREKFNVSLWDESEKPAEQLIEQVWFSGVHSDVGGGYKKRGLANITLKWLLEKSAQHGLQLKEGWQQNIHPNPDGVLHNSRTGLWKLWKAVHRKIPEGSKIYRSVVEREHNLANYQPQLPKDYTLVD